jgi:hypothetical protein
MVSKLNSDRKAGEGAGQALGRIYGKIGFGGLWNGLPVRIFMIGTLTAFQWLIYDSFKVYLGVSSLRWCTRNNSDHTYSCLPPEATSWNELNAGRHLITNTIQSQKDEPTCEVAHIDESRYLETMSIARGANISFTVLVCMVSESAGKLYHSSANTALIQAIELFNTSNAKDHHA